MQRGYPISPRGAAGILPGTVVTPRLPQEARLPGCHAVRKRVPAKLEVGEDGMQRMICTLMDRQWMVAVSSVVVLVVLGCAMPTTPIDNSNDNTVDVTVVVETEGQGEVAQSADGKTVTLTATPAEGWTFERWTGDDVESAAETNNPLTVDADLISSVITAEFVKEQDDPSGQTTPDDDDGDGVENDLDQCPRTQSGAEVDEDGCSEAQIIANTDSDGDGVADSIDLCPDTEADVAVNRTGCPDQDGDGVRDAEDDCPDTPEGTSVGTDGCPPVTDVEDGDGDGVSDDVDECPNTDDGVEVDEVGCAVVPEDDDNDGVANDADVCPDTKEDAEVDEDGCSQEQLDTDADGDGVPNEDDQCPNTPAGAAVEANGCEPENPGPADKPDDDGDGVPNESDQCPNTPAGTSVDAAGCTLDPNPIGSCGDGIGDCYIVHDTRGCENDECCEAVCAEDDYCCENSWDALCADRAVLLCDEFISDEGNDACDAPLAVTDGVRAFSNTTTESEDDPPISEGCTEMEMAHDIWFCYTATCSGYATISLCGSNFDTTMAVYAGCDCPDGSAIVCSDDDCGAGLESWAAIPVEQDAQYAIRIGGYPGNQEVGRGALSITCDATPDISLDTCGDGAGDCMEANGNAGCESLSCCEAICQIDHYCCEINWDESCAAAAEGICGGGFAVCGDAASGACDAENGSAGCDDADCCDAVCAQDFQCCTGEWDAICVAEAASLCQ